MNAVCSPDEMKCNPGNRIKFISRISLRCIRATCYKIAAVSNAGGIINQTEAFGESIISTN